MRLSKLSFIVIVFCLFPLYSCCQLLETRHLISVNVGYGQLEGNEGNLFFPPNISQSSIILDANYERKINPWLAGGLAIAYHQMANVDNSSSFAKLISEDETFITVGPLVSVHTPFKTNGVFNSLRFGLSVIPQLYFHSGNRSLHIKNEVQPIDGVNTLTTIVGMNNEGTGFGTKCSPEINYRITQRFGIRLAYNLQFLNVYTGYDNEFVVEQSLSGGFLFIFGNNKQIF